MKTQLRVAAKRLLWERGYAGMSPRQIQEASGAGQGSFYHHYRSKADLAADALREVEAEMKRMASDILASSKPPLARIRAFLLRDRDALKGCRIGRLANESEVLEEPALRESLARYFEHVAALVKQALDELLKAGEIKRSTDTSAVAATIIAAIQGGYLLSRAQADAKQLDLATRGAVAMLDALVKPSGKPAKRMD